MRYLPLTDSDRGAMLAAIGVAAVDDLYRDVPQAACLTEPLPLPPQQGEIAVERAIERLAARNLSPAAAPCFLGAGAYRHQVPAAVDHLIQRGEFLTSYTPYQPEISQGTLQVLFEFQTQVALITGMEVANASLYDGSTACAEAVRMATRLTRRRKAVLSGCLHPRYREVVETATRHLDIEVVAALSAPGGDDDPLPSLDSDTACLVVQNPGFFGEIRDLRPLAAAAHEAGALLIAVVTEPVSLGLVTAPGEMGADIVVAEGQALGNPMSFGGPGLGLFATRERFVRQMPGRLAGATVDARGRDGFVLTLATREQHIRREKATSNVCTNAGLCALGFTIHLALLGEAGFRRLAELNHAAAVALAERLSGLAGVEVVNRTFFNEFTLRLPRPAAPVVEALAGRGILGGVPVSRLLPGREDLGDLLLVAATETNTEEDMEALAAALAGEL
jgi:glycine dehydrogenase subunit 1